MEETGSPAHLRFLLRRLRQRAPQAHLVVALWPMEEGTAWEKVGADGWATTLREALSQCLDAAGAAVVAGGATAA
ncbi:MAG: hypothetical protein WDN04_19010 [Rhodospirillales bacterium]